MAESRRHRSEHCPCSSSEASFSKGYCGKYQNAAGKGSVEPTFLARTLCPHNIDGALVASALDGTLAFRIRRVIRLVG